MQELLQTLIAALPLSRLAQATWTFLLAGTEVIRPGGAGLHAGAAVGALLRVHNGGAVGTDGHSTELAGVHTGAEAQAAEAALQRTGGNLGGREAVLHAHILKALGRLAAVAADESYLTLTGGSSHAHDLSDGGSIVGACGSASGDRSVAGQNGGSAASAAGIAAAAAVRTGQMAEDCFLAGDPF